VSDTSGGGGFVSGLFGLLGGLIGGLSKSIANAIGTVALDLVRLRKGTVGAFDRTGDFLADVGGFFGNLFTHLLPTALEHIGGFFVDVAKAIRDVVGPVISLILKIRKEFLKYYNKFVRPITDTIDVIRRTFRILGVLGVDAAKTIDKKLAAIEAKIEAPMFAVVHKLNEVLGWVNRIVTLDGVLQELILLTSLSTYKRQVMGFALHSAIRPLTDQEQADYDTVYQSKSVDQHVDDLERAMTGQESYVAVLAQPYIDSFEELRAA
jgi:hypothetical protein